MEAVNNLIDRMSGFLETASATIEKQTGLGQIKQIKVAAVVVGVVGAIFAVAAIGSLAAAPISSAVVLLLGALLAIFARDVFVVCENQEKKESTFRGKFMSLLKPDSDINLDGTILLKHLA